MGSECCYLCYCSGSVLFTSHTSKATLKVSCNYFYFWPTSEAPGQLWCVFFFFPSQLVYPVLCSDNSRCHGSSAKWFYTAGICLHKLLSSVSCVPMPVVTDQGFKGISGDKPLSALTNPGVPDCTASRSAYEMEHKRLGLYEPQTDKVCIKEKLLWQNKTKKNPD